MGYATGQFGKNHLGDLNEYLPSVHGFDEFFGYLYHLNAMEDPAHSCFPQSMLNTLGPRNMVHSWATDQERPHRTAALGQRSASRRSRMPARCTRSGWRPWTTRFSISRSSSSTRRRPTTSPSSSSSTRRACTSLRTSRRSTKPCATRRMAGASRKPAWPSSTTSSARVMAKAEGDGRGRQHHRHVHHATTAPRAFTWPDGGETPFKDAKAPAMKAVSALLR